MLEQADNLDTVIVPVGGGGLISGIGLAIKETSPEVRVIGVQAGASTAVVDSYKANRRITVKGQATVADGIAVGNAGQDHPSPGFTLRRRYGRSRGRRDYSGHDAAPGEKQAAGGGGRCGRTCRRVGRQDPGSWREGGSSA